MTTMGARISRIAKLLVLARPDSVQVEGRKIIAVEEGRPLLVQAGLREKPTLPSAARG
jgi:hypothetical protein